MNSVVANLDQNTKEGLTFYQWYLSSTDQTNITPLLAFCLNLDKEKSCFVALRNYYNLIYSHQNVIYSLILQLIL